MTAIGCASPTEEVRDPALRVPIVSDDSLVHALDTSVEMRAVDRPELDTLLRDREIYIDVVDGMVIIAGDVWTPLEKERVGNLVRSVAGMIDVVNELDVRPPM